MNAIGLSSRRFVVIPEGMKSIEDYAFEECTSLTSIDTPEGVTSIEGGAFIYCLKLCFISDDRNRIHQMIIGHNANIVDYKEYLSSVYGNIESKNLSQ